MNLDDLRYFVEAASRENLSHAAKALAVTQSTVSHAIRRLEDDLGTELFRKAGRELRLTQAGRRLADQAARIVRDVHALKDAGAAAAPWPERVRAGATLGLPAQLLVRAWHRLEPRPTGGLWTQSLRSGDVLARLSRRDLDVGLCFGAQSYPGVALATVATSELVAAVRSGHPLLGLGRAGRIEALPRFALAAAQQLPGVGSCARHPVFALTGADPRPDTGFDEYGVATEILRGSDHWAVLPRAVVGAPGSGLEEVFADVSETLELSLAWPEGDELVALAMALRAALAEVCHAAGWTPADAQRPL